MGFSTTRRTVLVLAAALALAVSGTAYAALIEGTNGIDPLHGTAYADQIYGYDGVDRCPATGPTTICTAAMAATI